jgi:hypothetical protein
MPTVRFVGALVRFAAVASCLVAVHIGAQTSAPKTEPIRPDPGLVTDYWVHIGLVGIVLLCFGGLSIYALTVG